MPMGRYLCQLCYSIVHYGEKHPCFFYKDDDEIYTVPPPHELDEMERKDEMSKRTHAENLNDSNASTFAAAQQSCIGGSHETTSFLLENNEQISLAPASRRKRSRISFIPSKYLRVMKTGHLDSKTASSSSVERDGSKDAGKKSKCQRKMESASAVVHLIGNGTTGEMATNCAASGPVADAVEAYVAGPSGTQMQSDKTEKEKPFACEVCGEAFARKDNLEEHNRTHTGDKPFVCNTCGKAFINPSHLTSHFLTHTGDKSFACEFCSNRYTRKHSLVVHLRTHTGEKPFKCKFCGRDFGDRSNYRRHLKNIHGEE